MLYYFPASFLIGSLTCHQVCDWALTWSGQDSESGCSCGGALPQADCNHWQCLKCSSIAKAPSARFHLPLPFNSAPKHMKPPPFHFRHIIHHAYVIPICTPWEKGLGVRIMKWWIWVQVHLCTTLQGREYIHFISVLLGPQQFHHHHHHFT